MAGNRTRIFGRRLNLAVSDGGVNSGDPCLVGQISGVAETPKDASGNCVVSREGVYNLSVKGTNGANVAVAVGDKLFYTIANTPKIDKTVTGVFFGYALAAVVSGATTVIPVDLSGGSFS
jgi:predicted RecA/RadA family phage recombinase